MPYNYFDNNNDAAGCFHHHRSGAKRIGGSPCTRSISQIYQTRNNAHGVVTTSHSAPIVTTNRNRTVEDQSAPIVARRIGRKPASRFKNDDSDTIARTEKQLLRGPKYTMVVLPIKNVNGSASTIWPTRTRFLLLLASIARKTKSRFVNKSKGTESAPTSSGRNLADDITRKTEQRSVCIIDTGSVLTLTKSVSMATSGEPQSLLVVRTPLPNGSNSKRASATAVFAVADKSQRLRSPLIMLFRWCWVARIRSVTSNPSACSAISVSTPEQQTTAHRPSFPDSYVLPTDKNLALKVLGNAVPCGLAQGIGTSLLEALR